MDLTFFVQQFLNALQLGSLYALIALGYSMVYGVLLLINFAHGDIFMFGAFMGVFASMTLGLPLCRRCCFPWSLPASWASALSVSPINRCGRRRACRS